MWTTQNTGAVASVPPSTAQALAAWSSDRAETTASNEHRAVDAVGDPLRVGLHDRSIQGGNGNAGGTLPGSDPGLDREAAGIDGGAEGRVVAFVLVGVVLGECHHGPVERIAGPEVAGDDQRV